MAYFEDLTPYAYLGNPPHERTLNIGWLDRNHPFPQGAVSDEVLARVFALFANQKFPSQEDSTSANCVRRTDGALDSSWNGKAFS
jgi:hypothetical protein